MKPTYFRFISDDFPYFKINFLSTKLKFKYFFYKYINRKYSLFFQQLDLLEGLFLWQWSIPMSIDLLL